jgi:S1-C subfamily serine protease
MMRPSSESLRTQSARLGFRRVNVDRIIWLGLSLFVPLAARADMVGAIERIKPSIVIVGTYNPASSPRFQLRGTGFVAGNGNWVVTNAHVIPEGLERTATPLPATEPGSRLVVQVRTGASTLSQRLAKLIDLDPTHDLALLQFEGPAVPMLTIKNPDLVKEGQTIGLMGFPIGGALGFSPVTHRGMISSITTIALPTPTGQQLNARAVRNLREGNFQVFQLDATAYPGNSGGPLFDIDSGEVLGVVNMVFVKGSRESALTHPSGITYAIPSNFVQLLLQKNNVK